MTMGGRAAPVIKLIWLLPAGGAFLAKRAPRLITRTGCFIEVLYATPLLPLRRSCRTIACRRFYPF